MINRVTKHLDTITNLDLRGHAEAKRIREKISWREAEHEIADLGEAMEAAKALRAHIKRALAPHRVDFHAGPSILTNYSTMTASFHCSFELWPDMQPRSPGFRTRVRAPIKVDQFGARDAAEMAHILTGLKDAADRLAVMMFTDSGDRAND